MDELRKISLWKLLFLEKTPYRNYLKIIGEQ